MADNQQQPKALAGRLAAGVARHAHLSLALIVVLAVLVVGMYVYYHGVSVLGPYAGRRKAAGGAGRAGAAADPDGADGDPETERLIESINGQ